MGMVEGKIALITGAGSGLGRAGSLLFAREGAAHVYVADLNVAAGEETVELVREAGGSASFLHADVTDEYSVRELVERAVRVHDRLDCAWNNAGITDVARPFTALEKADFERMLDVNLTSVFVCLKHEIIQMEKQGGGGAIVNTSSASGVVATPGLPHYTAAKHGVLGLTKAVALEYNNKNIRCNAVCPGMVDTPLTQQFFDSSPKLAAAVQRLMPGGKLGQPPQIAEAVVWLCSDHASWVSGLSMVIDGGYVNR
jgi:NAD(P)-dependent dehydrogenase (short-subunit alcohol dehydrogenase family)